MAPVRETIRNTASRLVGVLKEKAQFQYREGHLKFETYARVFKRSIENTAPYIVATGLSKVRDSFNRTELLPQFKVGDSSFPIWSIPTKSQLKQKTHHSAATGRIEKSKRGAHPLERDPRWYDMAMKRKSVEMALEREIRLQESHQKDLAERKRRQQQRRKPSDQYNTARLIGIKDTRPQWVPLPSPSPNLTSNLQHPPKFYENQTHEERRAYILEKLTNVLGEERMREPMLPSGHNPMEPVIAEHNQRMVKIFLLNQRDAERAEAQRQHIEQIRLAREEEAARLKTQILLDHYKDIYQGRIDILAMYAGDMLQGIDRLEHLLQTGSPGWEVDNVMKVMAHQVFEPIYCLLQEFDSEIPLDPEGAEKLMGAWPMARLDGLYKFLEIKAGIMSPQAIYLLEGIKLIAQRLLNPTTFVDPLAPRPCPVSNFRLDYGSTNINSMSTSAPQATSFLPGAVLPPAGGWSIRGRASTSGLDPDAPEADDVPNVATSAPENSGISKLIAATAENITAKAAGTQIPPITVEPADSVARANVMKYIGGDHMALQAEMSDMFRNAEPKTIHRRAVTECIKGLMNAANNEEKILGTVDAPHYRSQIETCVTKIDALAKRYREVKDTKALRKLCGQALKIWAVQA